MPMPPLQDARQNEPNGNKIASLTTTVAAAERARDAAPTTTRRETDDDPGAAEYENEVEVRRILGQLVDDRRCVEPPSPSPSTTTAFTRTSTVHSDAAVQETPAFSPPRASSARRSYFSAEDLEAHNTSEPDEVDVADEDEVDDEASTATQELRDALLDAAALTSRLFPHARAGSRHEKINTAARSVIETTLARAEASRARALRQLSAALDTADAMRTVIGVKNAALSSAAAMAEAQRNAADALEMQVAEMRHTLAERASDIAHVQCQCQCHIEQRRAEQLHIPPQREEEVKEEEEVRTGDDDAMSVSVSILVSELAALKGEAHTAREERDRMRAALRDAEFELAAVTLSSHHHQAQHQSRPPLDDAMDGEGASRAAAAAAATAAAAAGLKPTPVSSSSPRAMRITRLLASFDCM